jgi:hypothetical protein
MSRRLNKKHPVRRGRRSRVAAVQGNRKSIQAPTKLAKQTSLMVNKNGAPRRSKRAPAFRYPKTELEAAIQRFVDLYDFAPIAYVSFDRAGRIEEANLAATELLGEPRDLLIGRPFAFYVGDLGSFMQHLLYCRTSQQQVQRITIEAEKRRANSDAPLQHADHFDDEKWRFALSNRHYGFERPQTGRRSAARERGRAGSDHQSHAFHAHPLQPRSPLPIRQPRLRQYAWSHTGRNRRQADC